MTRVFLCHRGDESGALASRIGERLTAELGPRQVVFGERVSAAQIRDGVAACDVVVLVLGREVRFDDAGECGVRQALEGALQQGLTLIPVRLAGVDFPCAEALPASLQPILFQNGLALRPEPLFERDLSRLVACVRNPASLAQPPSPHGFVVQVMSRSFRRMCWGVVLFALYMAAIVLAFALYFTFVGVEPVLPLLVIPAVPAVAGLAVGARYGWRGGLLGALFGALVPLLQLAAFVIVFQLLLNLAVSLAAMELSETMDAGVVVVPALCTSGALLWTALATQRAAARRSEEAVPARTLWRPALLGGLVGGAIGLALWIGVVRHSEVVTWHYRTVAASSVVLLLGVEFGLLDAALSVIGRKGK